MLVIAVLIGRHNGARACRNYSKPGIRKDIKVEIVACLYQGGDFPEQRTDDSNLSFIFNFLA